MSQVSLFFILLSLPFLPTYNPACFTLPSFAYLEKWRSCEQSNCGKVVTTQIIILCEGYRCHVVKAKMMHVGECSIIGTS